MKFLVLSEKMVFFPPKYCFPFRQKAKDELPKNYVKI